MANKKSNAFDKYQLDTKTAVIKALDGAEIKYRELTMVEDDKFHKMMVKGFDENGNPELDTANYMEIKYLKVAAGLLDPVMTVGDLKALPKSASDAIAEILTLISGGAVQDEGNSN